MEESNVLNIIILVVYLLFIALMLVANWKVFEKAGEPGWACLVPFYNIYVLLRIAGRPGWWLILAFIPIVNLILIVTIFDIARRFGKGIGFGLGMFFLPFIFYPILGFGDAEFSPDA